MGLILCKGFSLHGNVGDNAGNPRDGNLTLYQESAPYIRAIMNTTDLILPRLECPSINSSRYANMKTGSDWMRRSRLPRYYIALDLYQCRSILPTLIGGIVEAMRYLGPENCVLSIVEGRSSDGTFEVLHRLSSSIEEIGSRYILQTSDLNPLSKGIDRIGSLASLRNVALRDLYERPYAYSPDTAVIFINDVSLCAEDILELIFQRIVQNADVTCAMDWISNGPNADPTFYDVWVSRTINGDLFFDIPQNASWEFSQHLFWNDEVTRSRYQWMEPFQVFSCWNGLTAFTAEPLIRGVLKFRNSTKGECYAGEPQLFGKDMWYEGYGKIAVVPSINVEYTDENSRIIKMRKGFVSDHVKKKGGGSADKIDWKKSPPGRVKCTPGWENQVWLPWDEGLPNRFHRFASPPIISSDLHFPQGWWT
jgi:alpha-1,3-mannosyltransferase